MSTSQALQSEPAIAEPLATDGLPSGERLSLAEMTRIMDVAATLRKERTLVDEQLNIDQVKQKLRERLLEAARVSGDPVTADQIDAAIDQYYDRLHEFQEPPASVATFAAHVWVRRAPVLKALAAIAVVIAALWGLLAAGLLPGEARDRRLAAERRAVVAEREARDRRLAAEHQAAITRREATVESIARSIEAIAKEPAAKSEASDLWTAAQAAAAAGDEAKLAALEQELQALQSELELEYTLTIASQPGEQSAVERNWTDEKGTRTSGLYVFVEARDARGAPVRVPVKSRETGRITEVSRWGEQIPEAVFERLREDKEADGVLDERDFGVKRRGTRTIEVTLQGADSQALQRGGQITSW
jgi:hypothetical protein